MAKSDFGQVFKDVFNKSKTDNDFEDNDVNSYDQNNDYNEAFSQKHNEPPVRNHQLEAPPRPTPKIETRQPKSITTITKSTIIQGNIKSDEDIDFLGEIYGDVETSANLNASGKIYGNVTANRIISNDAVISGKVTSFSEIYIGESSRVIGDVTANIAEISGKIKGNIYVKDSVVLGKGAVVIGDISSEIIEVQKGAYVKGALVMLGMDDDNLIKDLPDQSPRNNYHSQTSESKSQMQQQMQQMQQMQQQMQQMQQSRYTKDDDMHQPEMPVQENPVIQQPPQGAVSTAYRETAKTSSSNSLQDILNSKMKNN